MATFEHCIVSFPQSPRLTHPMVYNFIPGDNEKSIMANLRLQALNSASIDNNTEESELRRTAEQYANLGVMLGSSRVQFYDTTNFEVILTPTNGLPGVAFEQTGDEAFFRIFQSPEDPRGTDSFLVPVAEAVALGENVTNSQGSHDFSVRQVYVRRRGQLASQHGLVEAPAGGAGSK